MFIPVAHSTATTKESACRIIRRLRQQTSPKRWFANANMTSYYDVAKSVYLVTMATRRVTREGEAPLEKFSPPLEKCVGRSLKLLDIVQKIWSPLRKLFAPPGVPSWLRAWWPPYADAQYSIKQSSRTSADLCTPVVTNLQWFVQQLCF